MLFALLLVNALAFFLMYIDKSNAKSGCWRIPERKLFLSVLLGGGVGGTLGMYLFRHKTKHWYFRYGYPVLAVLQIIIVLLLIFRKIL